MPLLSSSDPRIAQWSPMVKAIAKSAHRRGLCFWHGLDDVVAIGLAALWEATRNYDAARGANFGTYARHCVHTAYLTESTNLRRKKREGIFKETSLDRTYDNGELVIDPHHPLPSPAELLLEAESTIAIREAMKDLPPRDRLVLEARFHEQMGLADLGQTMGISRQRVQQLEPWSASSA